MPVYKYAGRTKKGRVRRGTIEAVSRPEAVIQLKEKGIRPIQLEETEATAFNRDLAIKRKTVKNRDFVIYCRQFGTLIRAGIPIVEATQILAEQTESKVLRETLGVVEEDVRSGRSFSEAAEKHPAVFPQLFVNMIRAGEMTGDLDDTLDRLASYFENQYTIKKKIQSTMIYPVVLLVLIVAVIIFMMIYIVPNFVQMFEQFGGELPMITRIVVDMSEFVTSYWWLLLTLFIFIIGGFTYMFRTNRKFHYVIHRLLLKLPIFGKLLQKSAIARMTRTLSSLFKSSVPILEALDVVKKVIGNPVIANVLQNAHRSLEQGGTLSQPLKDHWVFPPLVWQMTAIGEQTGSLDYMLEKIADFYEEDVNRTVDSLRSLIEPLMIILLAFCVGFIVLAIMIPMLSVFTEIQ